LPISSFYLGVFHFSWNRPEGWQKRTDFPVKTFGTFFASTHLKHAYFISSFDSGLEVSDGSLKSCHFSIQLDHYPCIHEIQVNPTVCLHAG